MKNLFHKPTQTQMIVHGYLLIILLGALLLTLPVSSKNGQFTNPLDALFTATSACCVTGLVIADTFRHWSTFGQITILMLIQIGGLGFMTFGVFFAIILRKKIGLWIRGTLQESVNIAQIGGIVRLAKKIIFGTLLFEGIGAVFLFFRFFKTMDFLHAVYYGIFHSISAFCNAGFDLFGFQGEYSSLTGYYNDPVVNIVIMSLIVIGGIGFWVWNDLLTCRWNVFHCHLHTKIVLTTTCILITGGALLLYLFERNNTLAGMTVPDGIMASFFGSVTARTAGFNTVDTAALTDSSKILTILLMFIGGSPGSTAGGIKTTTFVVLLVYVRYSLRNQDNCEIFGRRLDNETIKKASTVLCANLLLVVTAVLALSVLQTQPVMDLVFEIVSALGTVGMSTGITRDLTELSKVILIMLMFCGRVGGLTFALSLRGHKAAVPVKKPIENVTVG